MSLEIVPVVANGDLAAFIDVQWRIPALVNSPQWAPPLRMMVRDLLDTKGNPFYAKADRALFIAKRNGVPVGRIAAIENRAHNETHSDKVGFFGFFDAVDDPEVATQLLATAEQWLRARGLTAMRGPMSPSMNHDCGVLVDGFDQHQMFLTTWNPPYYEPLLTAARMTPIKTLLGYWLPYGEGVEPPPRIAALAERAAARANIVFRDIRPKRYWDEVAICWDVYNGAWEKNWGFVPMSRDEFFQQAKDMKSLLVPEFAFVAEVKGQPAGFQLSIPDFSISFKKNPSGRLFPFGLFHILRDRSRIRTGRIMALGIKQEFRTGSILPLFMNETARRARAYGVTGGEASWILEDNQAMRQPIETWGGRIYRKWRIFERPIA
jgi:hypothetical protein